MLQENYRNWNAVGYFGTVVVRSVVQNEIGFESEQSFRKPCISAASIKARYVNAAGNKVGALVSENITLQRSTVPEPASVILLGSGLAGIGLWGMKRRKNA